MTQRELLRWLCCPLCKRDLAPAADAYRCAACARSYPIVLGIPDLRAYPDPHVVSVEDDYRKGAQVQEQASRLRFTEQGVFLDGYDDIAGREEGTRVGLDNLEVALRREAA